MGITPAFNISLGNHLGKNTVGYLTYSTNWRVSEYNDVSIKFYPICIVRVRRSKNPPNNLFSRKGHCLSLTI